MQQTTWEKEDRQPALQRLSPAQDQGEQRLAVNAFLTEHWGSTVMMVRGEQGRLSLQAGLVLKSVLPPRKGLPQTRTAEGKAG